MIRQNSVPQYLGAFVILLAAAVQAESIETLQQRFKELPPDARRLTGPLFWLHGDESRDRLENYVQKVAEGGNGCFTAESRPHSDWLGEGWYRDLEICLQAAKKHNLKMWIFDEKWWPSGEVAGNVPQQYSSKYIEAQAVDVIGPDELIHRISPDKRIAVLAGKFSEQGIDGDSLVDLTGRLQEDTLTWQVPVGQWKIMIFSWRYAEGRGGNLLVDGASQDAVDWYIKTVYQPHYDRFKDDFGSWIPGFFYDEPETLGDWGTEVIPMLKERGVDWKKALTAWKFTLAGPEQAAAKYQYQDAFAEAWGRTLYGGITRWCREHNVQSIGHFLEHRLEYLHPKLCAGNMFQLQKYSDMGGIDAVYAQFVMGKRAANDDPTWQTPKLGSSISHVYGKTDDITMVEIFGARGQDLTYPEMKWWTDHMHVSGVNFHIPHSFNPRAPHDTDCPPYFYNGGFEPRWPLYRVYADYTTRLSELLSGGRHVCPVALLFAGNSCHVGKAIPPEQISEALQDALYDCDWMPYDVFENDTQLRGKQIALYQERYSILIVPPVEVIPYKTLSKVKQFYDNGGVILGYGFLPSKPADIGKTPQEINDLCQAIWGDAKPALQVCKTNSAGGRSYLLAEAPTPRQLQQVLIDDAKMPPTLQVLEGTTDNWLHVLHRVKDGRDIFFVTNQNIDNGSRTFRLRITAPGFPECWDPMRAEMTSIPFTRNADKVELSLTLEPSESILLVFADVRRPLPRRIDSNELQPIRFVNVVRSESASQPETAVTTEITASSRLADCTWIWHPKENAAASAQPGVCYFRKTFDLPPDKTISKARFFGTADNVLTLFINDRPIGDDQAAFDDWKRAADVDITHAIKKGANTVAIAVQNTTNQPSPAGLIGKLNMVFDDGSQFSLPVDASWKSTDKQYQNWQTAGCDDSNWADAVQIANYGAAPWGDLDRQNLTKSPVKKADPFDGTFDLPAGLKTAATPLILQMDGLKPEAAARITVNGTDIGGFISPPFRKDISEHAKPGLNTIRIEPFSPETIQVAVYPD